MPDGATKRPKEIRSFSSKFGIISEMLTFGYSKIKTIRFGSSLSYFGGNNKTALHNANSAYDAYFGLIVEDI